MSLQLLNFIRNTSITASSNVSNKVESNFDLADYEGYEMYDATHLELSRIYYSENGIESTDSYIYKYMRTLFPYDKLEDKELVTEYRSRQYEYDSEIKAAFEKDVREGVIPITVTSGNESVRLIDIDAFNSNYNMPASKISELKDEKDSADKLDTTPGKGLNTIVVDDGSEVVMLIEGSSANSDTDDWNINRELGLKSIAGEKFVPVVYEDALAKFRSYQKTAADSEKIQTVVGNSQGGGSAIYIGMHEPDVKVIAINPSPQIASTVKMNSKGNANITIIYSDSDPLYNISKIKGLGFETNIPGANIVHVDFGLDRFSGLESAHTGDISAIDYDKSGKIDEYEKGLGINIDDVIPKNVFTGDILGSNSSTKIVMNRDSMESFADYLNKLHTSELDEIIIRNNQAYEFNQSKREYKFMNLSKFTSDITFDLGMYFDQLLLAMQVYEVFAVQTIAEIGFIVEIAGEVLTNGHKTPRTEAMIEGIISILDFKIIEGGIETLENATELLNSVVGEINDTANEIARCDTVGHCGDYAIPDALKIVLKKLNEEEDKLRDAGETLEDCVMYIIEKFESTDEAISKMIVSNYTPQLDISAEKTYKSNQEYIKSLDILEKMNILNQFELVVDNGVEDIAKHLTNVFEPALEVARNISKHEDDIYAILDYQLVLDELESLKNPNYLKDYERYSEKEGYSTTFTDNNEYFGINDFVANKIIDVIENYLKPNKDNLNEMREVLDNIDELIVLVEDVINGLVVYLKPMIETLMYDTHDLGIVRDSLKLNSQVLYRMSVEMQNAYEVLNGEVNFMGKESLRELVKELNLRIGALNILHRDVFGDDSMQNIESMS